MYTLKCLNVWAVATRLSHLSPKIAVSPKHTCLRSRQIHRPIVVVVDSIKKTTVHSHKRQSNFFLPFDIDHQTVRL
jgi:hypothetical protein